MIALPQMIEWLKEAESEDIPMNSIVFHVGNAYCPAGWCAEKAGVKGLQELNSKDRILSTLGKDYKFNCPFPTRDVTVKGVVEQRQCGKESMDIVELFTHLTQSFWHEGHGLGWTGVIQVLEKLKDD